MKFSKSLIIALNFIERLGAFILLPFLISALTKAEYAIWTQFIIIPPLLATVISMGLGRGILNYFSNKDQKKASEYYAISIIIVISFVAVFFLFVINFLNHTQISAFLFGNENLYNLSQLLIATIFIEALYEIITSFIRSKQMFGHLAIFIGYRLFIKYVVVIGIFYFSGLSFEQGVATYIALLFIINIPYLLVFFIRLPKMKLDRSVIELFKSLFNYSLPLMISGFIFPFLLIYGRQALLIQSGTEALADFSLAYSLLGIPVMIAQTTNYIFFTEMALMFNSNMIAEFKRFFKNYLVINTFIFLTSTAFIVILYQDILVILGARNYTIGLPSVLALTSFFALFFIYFSYYQVAQLTLRTQTQKILMVNAISSLVSLFTLQLFSSLNILSLSAMLIVYFSLSFALLSYLLGRESMFLSPNNNIYKVIYLVIIQLIFANILIKMGASEISRIIICIGIFVSICLLDYGIGRSILIDFYKILTRKI